MRADDFDAEILSELNTKEKNELIRKNGKCKIKNGVLMVHLDRQASDVQYWKGVVPDIEIKIKIVKEFKVVPYSPHTGIRAL